MKTLSKLVFVLTVLAFASSAHALLWEIEKCLPQFGNLDQDDIPGFGGIACGPTAAVNSFVYLENAYPWVYDNSLIPAQGADLDGDGDVDFYDDMIAVAQTLGGPGFMNTIANNTTFHDDFIWGKQQYIESMVPGMTVYEAQDQWNWVNQTMPEWVEPVSPRWEFLYWELVDCEDVEILISWSDTGHFVTLTSFHWDDVNGNLVVDFGEGAWIDFTDPATGLYNTAGIWQSGMGTILETDYASGATITMAVSESPIPEPVTMSLLALGGLALLRKRR